MPQTPHVERDHGRPGRGRGRCHRDGSRSRLAARKDAEYYVSEYGREKQETFDIPEVEMEQVASIFRSYGLPETTVPRVAQVIRSERPRWIDFMRKCEWGLDQPDPARARTSAVTIAGSCIVGGLVPPASYFVLRRMGTALVASVVVTGLALPVFGSVKGTFTGKRPSAVPGRRRSSEGW